MDLPSERKMVNGNPRFLLEKFFLDSIKAKISFGNIEINRSIADEGSNIFGKIL